MADVWGARTQARAVAAGRARGFVVTGRRALLALGAGIGLGGALTMLTPSFLGAALPSYPLYHSFQIPLALPAITFQDEGARTLYTGTLRGTLGGLPLLSASFTYGPGPSKAAGGGTFSLATAAGEVRNGQILMTVNGERTTLLFFGVYLGTRLEFTLSSDRPQIGGSGVAATGLARTGFGSHEAYMAAVRRSADALPPSTRDEILAQADTNLRLVSGYEQKPPSP